MVLTWFIFRIPSGPHKGRKIYEWDSQHGELEGYRASDGQHLGSFDPNTGNQLKGPDPKRNIKKYL
ncbi:hypothetical protein ACCP35_004739 [Escherichia coli]